MRSIALVAAVALSAHAGKTDQTRYGFLQPHTSGDDATLLSDDMVVDEGLEEVRTPGSTSSSSQSQLTRGRMKRGGLAMLAAGLACAALRAAPGAMVPAKTTALPKNLIKKFANRSLAVSDVPVASTWVQGYRKGQGVMRHEVPINMPSWSTAVPGASAPTYTMVQSPAKDIPANPAFMPGGSGSVPGAAPIPSAEPPAGWNWPLKGQDITFNDGLVGSVVEFDMKGFGQIHCGCQANIYVTKAPRNDQPGACDAGGNGYGCYELDFMEGNGQAIGSTFHLCGDQYRGDFMCSDDRCLSSQIPGKQGGDECDSWGCATNTKDLPDRDGKKAYGMGGYIDSNEDFVMAMYFEAGGDGGLENAWVKLSQAGKDLTYKICDAANYIKDYTEAANGPWTTQSTYWGGGDGMEWLNGPCSDFPGSCDGSAGDHVQNVRVYKAVTDGAAPDSGSSGSGEKTCLQWSE